MATGTTAEKSEIIAEAPDVGAGVSGVDDLFVASVSAGGGEEELPASGVVAFKSVGGASLGLLSSTPELTGGGVIVSCELLDSWHTHPLLSEGGARPGIVRAPDWLIEVPAVAFAVAPAVSVD